MLVIFLSCYGACGLIAVIFPFVDLYLKNADQVTNVPEIYWKGLPFAVWWPYDVHNSTSAWILCFLSQGIWALFAPVIVTTAVVLCFYGAELILNHFKLLIFSVKNLDQRTEAMYERKYKQNSRTQLENVYEDCFYECIVQNVKHHHIILKIVEEFLALANYAIAVPFFGGALLLGLAGMNLLSTDDLRIGPKIFCASVGATEATNMFLLCVYGEKFQHEGEELFNSIICTRWYKRSMKCRKALMIMQCGSFRPPKITAARMIELNMATFSNLVNSAYSIFNLNSVASATEDK
ncbi:hypothetical protein GE061_009817 [Apolygus lucorum]|uniref:Uncharacterized protein n=1 Tax=Apolygus lucorum TaxID=248454 RepID=A0A6A4KF16_APOLU|nr:hypothetical protein GE061_009817 [Apolygus lucorum]